MLKFVANLAMLFQEHELADRFRASSDFGFDLVEIPFPYELPAQRIKRELERYRQKLWLIDLPVGDFSAGQRGYACDPEKKEQFKAALDQALDYAEILGVERLTCLVGKRLAKYSYERQWRTLVENLRYASQRVEADGRTLLVEMLNCIQNPDYFLAHSAPAARLIGQVDHSNCLMQYDLYHMQLMEGNLVATIQRHLPQIGHIQIANVPGRHQPGRGEIDYNFIFRELERMQYTGGIGLEYIPYGSTVDSLAWLKDLVPAA